MQAAPTHRGEMSQDSTMEPSHQRDVDPAARRGSAMYKTLSASSVGLEFALCVIIGALFGRWLDGKFATTPWLLLVGIVLGFVAGLRVLLRVTKKMGAPGG